MIFYIPLGGVGDAGMRRGVNRFAWDDVVEK
jgi:hypothetical protein